MRICRPLVGIIFYLVVRLCTTYSELEPFPMQLPQENKPIQKVLHVRPNELSPSSEDCVLLVECSEKRGYLREGELYDADFEISYKVLAPERHRHYGKYSFYAQYKSRVYGTSPRVCIVGKVSGQAFFVDPGLLRGRRIGTYLMDTIVGWVKQWPDADVWEIELRKGQAGDDPAGDHKERRNQFYKNFNIDFDWEDPTTQEAGVSKPMKVADLQHWKSWEKNMEEHDVTAYIQQLLEKIEKLEEEKRQLNSKLEWQIRRRQEEVAAQERVGTEHGLKLAWLSMRWLVGGAVVIALGIYMFRTFHY